MDQIARAFHQTTQMQGAAHLLQWDCKKLLFSDDLETNKCARHLKTEWKGKLDEIILIYHVNLLSPLYFSSFSAQAVHISRQGSGVTVL